MRHLLSPLDFSVEELDNLMNLAKDIEANPKNMHTHVKAKSLPLFSMNRAHVPD